ncbi:MAG: hypothetical protein ACI9Y1_002656 [Lentisphaeria bacterium]|jgi:hypothetical protein
MSISPKNLSVDSLIRALEELCRRKTEEEIFDEAKSKLEAQDAIRASADLTETKILEVREFSISSKIPLS